MISKVTSLPERPRTYRFALTPLADAMFQLLIFFMLSSSLTPYSLVTLRGTPDNAQTGEATETAPPQVEDETATTPASAASDDGPKITTWTLGDGIVIVNGQIFEADALADLAAAIGTRDEPGRIVIIVGDQARVQDIATAVEALDTAQVSAVQITRERP